MLQLSREERLLKLEHVYNCRDLGGYETQEGRYTKAHHYVRSSGITNATEEDLENIYEYGVRAVVDVRGKAEKSALAHQLKDYKDIEYYDIDLLTGDDFFVLPKEIRNYKDLSGFYIYIIEAGRKAMKEVFKVFLDHPYDCVLFNCSAGKDRTGVISALLLDLAGCHEYDIVKDYSESFENNLEIMESLEKLLDDEKKSYLSSAPTVMMKFYNYLYETYGSSYAYLLSCGLTEEELDDIKENFVI